MDINALTRHDATPPGTAVADERRRTRYGPTIDLKLLSVIDFLTGLPGQDGVIRGPASDGRVAAVARANVARVVAAVLPDPDRHRGVTYDLTGPEALDFSTIADILGAHSGQVNPVSQRNHRRGLGSRKKWDAPCWQYDAWVSTYTAIATGTLAPITDHVEDHRAASDDPCGVPVASKAGLKSPGYREMAGNTHG
jgi:hypothetical protein